MKLSNKTKNARTLFAPKKEFVCFNCKRKTADGHFVPPSIGEEGFWICEEPIPPDAVRLIDENFWKLVA